MKKAIIVALLLAQANSAPFYDIFTPIEDTLGSLFDVVTNIKQTIDCTILEVERVFTFDGLFESNSDYDERCGGRRKESADQNSDVFLPEVAYTTEELTGIKTDTNKKLAQEIDDSVLNASHQIQKIIYQSNAQQEIETAKNTLKNESDRLTQISAVLRKEVDKFPESIQRKLSFNTERPNIKGLLDQVKMLYQFEQKDRNSAQSYEVRRAFNEVLNILHVNKTDGMNDEDQVKNILTALGESTSDVEKQVSLWTEKEKRQFTDTKVIINTFQTKILETKTSDNKSANNDLIKGVDEINKQDKKANFSISLKNTTENILDQINVTVSPRTAPEKAITEHLSNTSSNRLYTLAKQQSQKENTSLTTQASQLSNSSESQPTSTSIEQMQKTINKPKTLAPPEPIPRYLSNEPNDATTPPNPLIVISTKHSPQTSNIIDIATQAWQLNNSSEIQSTSIIVTSSSTGKTPKTSNNPQTLATPELAMETQATESPSIQTTKQTKKIVIPWYPSNKPKDVTTPLTPLIVISTKHSPQTSNIIDIATQAWQLNNSSEIQSTSIIVTSSSTGRTPKTSNNPQILATPELAMETQATESPSIQTTKQTKKIVIPWYPSNKPKDVTTPLTPLIVISTKHIPQTSNIIDITTQAWQLNNSSEVQPTSIIVTSSSTEKTPKTSNQPKTLATPEPAMETQATQSPSIQTTKQTKKIVIPRYSSNEPNNATTPLSPLIVSTKHCPQTSNIIDIATQAWQLNNSSEIQPTSIIVTSASTEKTSTSNKPKTLATPELAMETQATESPSIQTTKQTKKIVTPRYASNEPVDATTPLTPSIVISTKQSPQISHIIDKDTTQFPPTVGHTIEFESTTIINVNSVPLLNVRTRLDQTNTQVYHISTESNMNIDTSCSTAQSIKTVSTLEELRTNIQNGATATESSQSSIQQQLPDSSINLSSEQQSHRNTQNISTTPAASEASPESKMVGDIKTDDYQDSDDYSDSDDQDTENADVGNQDVDKEIEELFAPQDKAAQQEAVKSAKSFIEESQKTNTFLKSIFNRKDLAAAPTVFDDPEYFS